MTEHDNPHYELPERIGRFGEVWATKYESGWCVWTVGGGLHGWGLSRHDAAKMIEELTPSLTERLTEHDSLLDNLIGDVEAAYNQVRIEYRNMKHSYVLGDRQGYTKRQVEDKMLRMTGEILGLEQALSVLYTRRNARTPQEEDT